MIFGGTIALAALYKQQDEATFGSHHSAECGECQADIHCNFNDWLTDQAIKIVLQCLNEAEPLDEFPLV